MKAHRFNILLGIALLSIASAGNAAVYTVSPGGSIQGAINGASPGLFMEQAAEVFNATNIRAVAIMAFIIRPSLCNHK